MSFFILYINISMFYCHTLKTGHKTLSLLHGVYNQVGANGGLNLENSVDNVFNEDRANHQAGAFKIRLKNGAVVPYKVPDVFDVLFAHHFELSGINDNRQGPSGFKYFQERLNDILKVPFVSALLVQGDAQNKRRLLN